MMRSSKKTFVVDSLDSRYFTIRELSRYLKRSPGALRNLVLRRKIPFHKPGGRLLFDKEEIDLWIKRSAGVSLDDLKI